MAPSATQPAIEIQHHSGSYPVVRQTLSEALGSMPSNAFLLTDQNLVALCQPCFSGPILALTPGEGSKTLESYGQVLSWLAASGARRDATLVAFGGGVIGDLGGFVGSSYMRGIRFVQIPTSLLAMVDSSVGGKVGIDLPEGKNLAGAFYPPSEVRLCLDALTTLPPRELRCGMAEVIKYGFIMDSELADQLATPPQAIADLEPIVLRCIALKAQVVQEDEFETTGRRAILNFGHTVAHAIEHATGYDSVKHGEAVGIGMVVEAVLGEQMGVTPSGIAARVAATVAAHGLPTTHEVLANPDVLLAAMRRDKKADAAGLAFSLLTDWGACKLFKAVEPDAVRRALEGSK